MGFVRWIGVLSTAHALPRGSRTRRKGRTPAGKGGPLLPRTCKVVDGLRLHDLAALSSWRHPTAAGTDNGCVS
jgi:hypothetical protein